MMELNDLDKYKSQFFNIAVIILAAFIAFNFIYKKQFRGIESLKQKKETEIKKNHVLENISKLENKINAYKTLLAQKDTVTIINTITDMAKESGVKIISMKPGQGQVYPDYIKFVFDLTIEVATYHTLGKFISKLESYQDAYIVDAIDITTKGQRGILAINLKISNLVFTE